MKKNILKIVILLILFTLISSTHYSSLANYQQTQTETGVVNLTTLETESMAANKKKKDTKKKDTTKKKKDTKKEESSTKTTSTEEKTVDTIDTSIKTNSGFADEFNPQNGDAEDELTKPFTGAIVDITNIALKVIQTIGGLLMIVSIAIYGFYMVTMSHGPLAQDLGIGGKRGNMADAKIGLINFGRGLLIGSVLLFSSATLVRFVFNIFVK